MRQRSLKALRRDLLLLMYERYMRDPLYMLTPLDFKEALNIPTEDLVPAVHYLSDSGLVELMIGYSPPMFAAVRITAKGIDLVEHPFELNRRFPPDAEGEPGTAAALPSLVEALLVESELSPLNGARRHNLLRDVHYLREEIAQPSEQWRFEVIETVLRWLEATAEGIDDVLPSLAKIREMVKMTLQR